MCMVIGLKCSHWYQKYMTCFEFLNRSITFFSKEQIILKAKEKNFINIEASFIDEISGLAIVNNLDSRKQCMVVLKLKFIRNQAS